MSTFYVNGKFINENDAKISVFDLGLNRAYAVFDFLRTYNGKPFYLNDHLKRLLNSAKLISLKHSYNLNKLRKIVLKTLVKNKNPSEVGIRIILTGGEAKDFLTLSKPNLIVIVTSIKKLPGSLYAQGAKLIAKVFERIIPQAKTIVYTEGIKFLQEAKRKGAIEVLLISKEGEILECTTSNFFAVINKKLITPPKEKILAGITRKVVIQLAKKMKIPIIERDIYYQEIKNFDEAFITATNKEILPIVKIDNFPVGSKKIGKITQMLMREFKKLTKNYNLTNV